MPKMINRGKEIIRICPTNPSRLEYSTNGGRIWNIRYLGTTVGKFIDLMDNGKEILGTTDKGLYYSTNDGRIWNLRHR